MSPSDLTSSSDQLVTEMLAKESIREVIYTRARAADRKDVELALACYHDGATEDHGGFRGSAVEFLQQSPISGDETSPIKSMWHSISNILIDIEGDYANVETYNLCAITATKGGIDYDMLVGGRYLDKFTCENGKWAISSRILVFDWSRVDLATVPYWIAMGKDIARLPFGRGDRTDPLYTFLAD